MDTKKLLAELLGTFAFFLIGFMAILSTNSWGSEPSLVVIAFGFGLGLLVGIQIFGSISGGHYNPAVTVAAVLDGRLDPMTGVGYVVSQLIGGIGAAALVLTMSSQAGVASTETLPNHALINDIQAVIIETVFTAFFILVILTVTKKAPSQAAFAIPLTLIAIHFAIVPFTGASVNPARSIASAVIGQKDLNEIWIYIVGPILGAAIGWAIYRFANGDADAA